MKYLFSLTSLRNGKLYRLTAAEVQSFYDEEVMGRAKRGTLLQRLAERGIDIQKFLGKAVDPIRATGTVLLQLFNSAGELIDVRAGANLVVDTGKAAVIDRLQAASPAVHDYQAIGTGNTAAASGDTALQTETGTRVQGTLSQPAATTDRLVSAFAAANGTGALTETGRLNASSSGNLFARQVFSVVNKGASDTFTVTHDITIS